MAIGLLLPWREAQGGSVWDIGRDGGHTRVAGPREAEAAGPAQAEFVFCVCVSAITVTFNTCEADDDPAPLFRGLPNDACQCPHWGTVLTGKLVFRYADHDETYTAGDAYYCAPVPLSFAGSESIEFSPSAEPAARAAAVGRNMQQLAEHA